MKKLLLSCALAAAVASPALADEFTDTVALALEAYEEGDIAGARDEMEYAVTLLQGIEGAGFQSLLPEPLDGWTREIDTDASAGMAMMGGGSMAMARYSDGEQTLELTLISGGAMAASLGAMLGNTQTMAMMGKVTRIKRKSFVNSDGDLQGMVGNVIVQLSGSASQEVKIEYIKALDFKALKSY
jgi:hypothetical protein